MTKRKPAKSLLIIIVLIAIPVLIGGGFALYLTSTTGYCGDYAKEKSRNSDSPDWDVAELRDQCLRDRGLGGF